MAKILVSGLINTETTVRIKQFPIEYFPIDYPFFGVNTRVSGVAYNLVKALKTLDDDVKLVTMTGKDFGGDYIQSEVEKVGGTIDVHSKEGEGTRFVIRIPDGQVKHE